MGHCADRLRRDEDAIRHFEAYLERAPEDAANRDEAERRLRALREAAAARNAEAARVTPLPVERTAPVPSGDITSEGWFWPVVGGGAALVIGGVIIGIVFASQPQPEPGNVGGIVTAINGRF